MKSVVLAFCAPGPMRGCVEQHVNVGSWDGLESGNGPRPANASLILLGVCERPRLPLGPLEPLRAVAEMARTKAHMTRLSCSSCSWCGDYLDRPEGGAWPWTKCGRCGSEPLVKAKSPGWCFPFRLVVACHSEPAKCAACAGRGRQGSAWDRDGSYDCNVCSGTGKALGSAEIANELAGRIMPDEVRFAEIFGGLSIINYPSRAALEARAIGDTLKLAMEGT